MIDSTHPLIGHWKSTDDFDDVVVTITPKQNSFAVSVRDHADGEQAEIFETNYDGDTLSFAAHWASNGRLIKYRFLLQSEGTVNVTYTFSDQEIWQKQTT
ncbi:hypothetical protein ACFOEK_03215 [Litoribrevibacter euphylliae]|uniref:Uncharacterized protein n=1 Tax=Litoribrevibacter euphylliae TaxID=1834034 RepID=A0ABV7HEP7_9GAMM